MAETPGQERQPGLVYHTPKWEYAHLPIDGEGNTRLGYICIHELENGGGRCGANVFKLSDASDRHCCVVISDEERTYGELEGEFIKAAAERDAWKARFEQAEDTIRHFAAEAHRRKWAHQGSGHEGTPAFDELHRLGNELLEALKALRPMRPVSVESEGNDGFRYERES